MAYRYHFDEKVVGDLRLNRPDYEILQAAYCLLRDELDTWNDRLVEHGASRPYSTEADDLAQIIDWGREALSRPDKREVVVEGISTGSCRYAKAALSLMLNKRGRERYERARQGWPSAALRALDDTIAKIERISDIFSQEPSELLWEFLPRMDANEMDWDVFICHASEDRAKIRMISHGLLRKGSVHAACGFGLTSSS